MPLLWMLLAANGGAVARARSPKSSSPARASPPRRTTSPPTSPCSSARISTWRSPRKLADLLRRVAGVHVDQVGGRGGTGSLYMRGADPNYTLVLVDGVRVNDPTNARGGSFDFSALDIADVERVEIARGPYSAVYGGDALAGVINIVTRHARAREGLRLARRHGRRVRHARNLR